MNYTKILIFFIIGIFIYNLFCKKDIIEGMEILPLLIPSEFHSVYILPGENYQKSILVKILESNIVHYSPDSPSNFKGPNFDASRDLNIKLKDALFIADIQPETMFNHYILSNIRFKSPELEIYNDTLFDTIMLPISNISDPLNPASIIIYTLGNKDILFDINSLSLDTNTYIVSPGSNEGSGVFKFYNNDNNISYSITLKIINYLDEDTDMIVNNKEKIKKYIYSQFIV